MTCDGPGLDTGTCGRTVCLITWPAIRWYVSARHLQHVLFSPQPAFEGGQCNTPVIFVIAENPLQTEEMPLESPHGNLFTFSL